MSKQGLLLLHGLTGGGYEFETLKQRLEEKYLIHQPKLAGHSSAKELHRTKAESWIEQSREYFSEASAAGPCSVLGVSFGATISILLAEEYPDLVSKLILIAPPLRIRTTSHEYLMSLLAHAPDSFLGCLGYSKKKGDPARTASDTFSNNNAISVYPLSAVARSVYLRKKAIRNLHKLRSKTLVLFDPKDYLIHPSSVGTFLSKASSAEVKVEMFSGAGHSMLGGDRGEEVVKCISEFL